jgi:LmbE family N-acetylglucosaminyl deacetylase
VPATPQPRRSREWDGFGRIVVISPHLDDGVFACGDLLRRHPGSTVVTVFAGGPADWDDLAPWDRSAGFGPGDDVVAARRREDAAALARLEAHPLWLPFWDSQYGRPAPADAIRRALESAIRDSAPDAAILPLGLWHSDHRLTQEAARGLPSRLPRIAWFAYADAIYRRYPDAGMAERLEELRRTGLLPTRLRTPVSRASAEKRRAAACYASQLRALGTPGRPGTADVFRAERYWRLAPGRR